ncbi:ABC-three component system protein [Treponema succinifaciens]|uniref:ABC-three component system protein n=1 Tax=Treponema succinifaciens TaxID=167 RepID=UPI003F7F50C5
MLRFSEFICLFEPYFKQKKSYHDFLIDFIDLIIDDEKIDKNPFDEIDNSFARKIIKGEASFPVDNAKFLINVGNFNKIKFEDAIFEIPEQEKIKIVEELNRTGIQTTLKTFEQTVSELFYEIISDIALGKKQEKVSLNTNSGQKDLEQKYGLSLLQECNSLCPLPECSKPLYVKKDEEKQPYFQIIQINPQKPYDRLYNLLAVCPKCAAKLNMQKTEHDILRLAEIKQRMQKNEEISELSAEEKIGQDITSLIEKITNAESAELSELNYSPIELKKKFLPSEHQLEDEIKPRVVKYFNFINELLKQKVEKENFNETKFRRSIKRIYENLESEKIEKTQIFEAISERLYNMSKTSHIACQILASYFVQSCEIFTEVAQQ